MIRPIGLLIVLSLVACGTESAEVDPAGSTGGVDRSVTSSVAPSSSVTSTMMASTSTVPATSTTDATDGGSRTGATSPTDFEAIDLAAGVPIDPPEDFPSIAGLAPEAFLFSPPHPRARISSRVVVADELAESIRQTSDPNFSGSIEITITYVDSITIYDYPNGLREAKMPGREYLYLADDGTWRESDRFEWPAIFPLTGWGEAQGIAEGMVQADPVVIGYEILADTPTVHLRWEEAGPDVWADVWLDATGAAIRAVMDMGLSEPGQENQMLLVWDVQSLAPEEVGPLPTIP